MKRNTAITMGGIYLLTLQASLYGVDSRLTILNPMIMFYGFDILSGIRFTIVAFIIFTWRRHRIEEKGTEILS